MVFGVEFEFTTGCVRESVYHISHSGSTHFMRTVWARKLRGKFEHESDLDIQASCGQLFHQTPVIVYLLGT